MISLGVLIESSSTNRNHLINTYFRSSTLPSRVHTLSHVSLTTDHNLTASN